MITSYDELPPHFKELYKTLPPRLPIPRACEVGGETSRATLYEKIGDGRVAALKDGGKTLVDTLSLLINMANLPAADIAPPRRKPTAKAASAATEARRKRDQAPASEAPGSSRTANKATGKPRRQRGEATAGA
jgi:hypothetical protein